MVIKDHRGAPLTGADTRAVELYETAICQFNCYVGDPVATVDNAIAESPDFAMAIALKAYLLLSGMERGPVANATELLAKLRTFNEEVASVAAETPRHAGGLGHAPRDERGMRRPPRMNMLHIS